jgi:predicted transcriptional regulator of viral defense system
MKSKKNLLEQLQSLPYFTKNTVYQLGTQLELKDATIDTYISRFLTYREILPLKKGLYVSADFLNKHKDDISYTFYLANIIRAPSYVSSWTALQYYDFATEAIRTVTSVTPKITRDYKTKAGDFMYQSIQKELFSDFSSVQGKFDFFIASPSKALFDLLYFKTRQFRGVRLEDIESLIDELRIDIDEMDSNEQKSFSKMIKEYFSHE